MHPSQDVRDSGRGRPPRGSSTSVSPNPSSLLSSTSASDICRSPLADATSSPSGMKRSFGVPRLRKPPQGTRASWTSFSVGSEVPGGFFSRSMQTELRDDRSVAPCPVTDKQTTRAGAPSPPFKSSGFHRLAVK
ncbi:uncharacterized protein LOC144100514 [Amblyomma americanum]